MRPSGNCWKAATILALTGHAFAWVHNAILLHFGEGTGWLPAPGLARTRGGASGRRDRDQGRNAGAHAG